MAGRKGSDTDDFDDLLDADGARRGAGDGDRPVIVVVDDDAGVRDALVTLFEDRYRVVACAEAQSGVDAVDEETCTVILDVKMKGHDGFWTCHEMRKKVPGVPVIFFSAYQDLKDPFAIINDHRPFGYITKDGSIERLVEAVDVAVRLQQMTVISKKLLKKMRQERGGRG